MDKDGNMSQWGFCNNNCAVGINILFSIINDKTDIEMKVKKYFFFNIKIIRYLEVQGLL